MSDRPHRAAAPTSPPEGRFGRAIVLAAIFVALFPSWRHPDVFFTLSDFLFCIGLVILALRGGLPAAPFGRLTPLWYGAFSIFVISLLGSSLIRGEPDRGLIVCLQYTFAYIVLPFAIMQEDGARTITMIKVFVAGVVVANLTGMLLYHLDYQGGVPFITDRYVSGSGRLGGFLEDPNLNASMIAVTCPFVLFLWVSGAIRIYTAVPVLVTLMIALIMASSVTGLLAGTLGIVTFLLASSSWRVFLQALVGLTAGVGIVLAWTEQQLPAVFETRVLGALRSGDIEQAGTFADRWALIQEAWGMVDQTLLYGLGADQFRVVGKAGMPVHNLYLLFWTEGGLPALVAWVALLLIAILAALYVHRTTPYRLIGGLGLAVALVLSFVGMASAHLYGRHWAIPLELALALVIGALNTRRAWHQRQEQAGAGVQGTGRRDPIALQAHGERA